MICDGIERSETEIVVTEEEVARRQGMSPFSFARVTVVGNDGRQAIFHLSLRMVNSGRPEMQLTPHTWRSRGPTLDPHTARVGYWQPKGEK